MNEQTSGRQPMTLTATLGGQDITVVTRPGYAGWEAVSQAERLLAQYAEVNAGERVLVLPAGHGALGAWAAGLDGEPHVTLLDTNSVAVEMARRTLAQNGARRAQVLVGLPHEAAEAGSADVVLLRLPKGRQFTRLLFLEAFAALRPGGRLYLAGANNEGIKSAVRDGEELYGPAALLAYKGGNRVVEYRRAEALPDPLPAIYQEPGVAAGTWHEYRVGCEGGEDLLLRTRPGVFAWRGLDAGTALLLEHLRVVPGERVLDVGCGAGAIGLCAARLAPEGRATLVDVDALACTCARLNAEANGLGNVRVVLGDGIPAVGGERYTLVVSNPSFHSGHAVEARMATDLVREAQAVLEPRGRLVLVANRFLPYDRLLKEHSRRVEVLAQNSAYWVLSAWA